MLKAGTTAPSFRLPDQNGEMHSLEEYRGKKEEETFFCFVFLFFVFFKTGFLRVTLAVLELTL